MKVECVYGPIENSIDEKIILLNVIGVLEALENNVISIDEANAFMFSPRMVSRIRMYGGSEDVINLIECGCELEDIESLIPHRLKDNIAEMKERALDLIREYPEYISRSWIKGYSDER